MVLRSKRFLQFNTTKMKTRVLGKFRTSGMRVSFISNTETYIVNRDMGRWIVHKDQGGPFIFIDEDITSRFKNISFTGPRHSVTSGQIQYFEEIMTHGEVIEEAKRIGIYKEYHIVEALRLGGLLTSAGEILPGMNVFFYLENIVDGQKGRLSIYVGMDGFARTDWGGVSLTTKLKTTYGALFGV